MTPRADWRIARFQKTERKRQFRESLRPHCPPLSGDIDVSLGAVVIGGSFLAALLFAEMLSPSGR